MTQRISRFLAATCGGSATGLAFYKIPIRALATVRAAAANPVHRTLADRLSATGWYLFTTRAGLRVRVDKVGQSRNVLQRVRGQASKFDQDGTVLVAVAAPDSSLDSDLRLAVEWALGSTVARAAAHGLMAAAYTEPFTAPVDGAVEAIHVERLLIDVLTGLAEELGCARWQLLQLRQPITPLWPRNLRGGRNRKTLKEMRQLFDAGLISPGDRLRFLSNGPTVTVTERLLCRLGVEQEERPLGPTTDAILAGGGYSPNTRRNAWEAFSVISNDERHGATMKQLRSRAPDRIAALTTKCHLPR